MALRSQVVNFIRLGLLDNARQIRGISQIPMMQEEPNTFQMRIAIQMIDSGGVEHRGTTLDAVHYVAFVQQKLRQVSAVLTSDAGDECDLLFRSHQFLCLS